MKYDIYLFLLMALLRNSKKKGGIPKGEIIYLLKNKFLLNEILISKQKNINVFLEYHQLTINYE